MGNNIFDKKPSVCSSVSTVLHEVDNMKVEFLWKRVRLFDELTAQGYHDLCLERPTAKVEQCQSKPKSKWRPLPMDTVVNFSDLLLLPFSLQLFQFCVKLTNIFAYLSSVD